MTPASIRQFILEKIPEGSVIPRHTEKEHLYEVIPAGRQIFKSVTTRLQVVKDESLINYKMNRALEYVFANFDKMTNDNIMEHLENASQVSGGILKDAGDIGTAIHSYREAYFEEWIKNWKRPESALAFIPPWQVDPRAKSGMRALEKFVVEEDYIPLVCEMMVWDVQFRVAGTLDDVGLLRKVLRPGTFGCQHELIMDEKLVSRCLHCDRKTRYELVLVDLKTSNQFKDHYFFQVALYFMMFCRLTGLRPKRCLILKVSKEDGSYKIEELFKIGKLVGFGKSMLRTNDGLDFIKSVRKDNQKKVLVI